MSRYPEWNCLDAAAQRRVMAAADAAVANCDLGQLDVLCACVAPHFDGERLALLRMLLREHLELLRRRNGPLPKIDACLAVFQTDAEHNVIRDVLGDELPSLAVEIIRELGRGGMGVVYEARQPAVGQRRVAVKTLVDLAVGQRALWTRLREEVEVLGQLRNQHIVMVHEVGLLNGCPAFIMELAEHNLEQLTGNRPYDQRESARIVRHLALAIQSAHEHPRRILHLDLKPSNVLVMPDGTSKVADFGLMRAIGETHADVQGPIVGSPGYLAPEQAQRQAMTFATDVWGLGGILYFLVTGKSPFPKRRDRIDAPVTTPLPTPRRIREDAGGDELDPRLEAIIIKALQKDPHERYERALDLGRDLQRFLDEQTVLAPLVNGARRGLKLGISVALAFAVVGIAVFRTLESGDTSTSLGPPVAGPSVSSAPTTSSPVSATETPLQKTAVNGAANDEAETDYPTGEDRTLADKLESRIDAMRPLARHAQSACKEFKLDLQLPTLLGTPAFENRWRELINRQPPVTSITLSGWQAQLDHLHREIGTPETSEALKRFGDELTDRQIHLESFCTSLDRDLAALGEEIRVTALANIDPPPPTPSVSGGHDAPQENPAATAEPAKASNPPGSHPPSTHPTRAQSRNNGVRSSDSRAKEPSRRGSTKSAELPEGVVFFSRTIPESALQRGTPYTLQVSSPDVWSFVPKTDEDAVRQAKDTKFYEDWSFDSGRGEHGHITEFLFRRTLRVQFTEADGRSITKTLDERAGHCTGSMASKFWRAGLNYFVAEPQLMVLQDRFCRFSDGAGEVIEHGHFRFKGRTRNHYEVFGGPETLIVWSLTPVNH